MNDLEKYFLGNTGKLISKWNHYFDVYDRHFSKFRGTDVHIVEFGVFQGGSLQMWKDYFGPKARIYGVDINPHCKQLEEEQVKIFIGDQADKKFLRSIADAIPRIDILLDDGGHTMEQQINTFEVLFPKIDKNGVYLCEDIHTSYWRRYGGGYKKRGTFIEYSKNFIDYLHAWHSKLPRRLAVSDFTRSVTSLHYYDSILVIEKGPREKPAYSTTGTQQLPDWDYVAKLSRYNRIRQWLKKKMF
jgi:23S rRNA U2552 (ribose-2'-O)-methylase RlmE/FtsJ